VKQLGVIGDDSFGEFLVDDLRTSGVSTELVRQVPGASAFAIIIVDANGERTMLSHRDIVTSDIVRGFSEVRLNANDHMHVSGYAFQTDCTSQIANKLLAEARKAGAATSIDPSFQFACNYHESHQSLINELDYLFPNEDEAYQMTGDSLAQDAAAKLLDSGVKCVIVTGGRLGCLIANATLAEFVKVPAYEVSHPVDTTGAGDGFVGGFLAARMKGIDLELAARVGHAVAANVIMDVGGHVGSPNVSKMQQFAEEHEDPKLLQALVQMYS
jgi:sugar/nucleoside kinase (ribokinase family)